MQIVKIANCSWKVYLFLGKFENKTFLLESKKKICVKNWKFNLSALDIKLFLYQADVGDYDW